MTSCLLQSKEFYCREWAFGKVLHCLENRATAKTCGVLVVGGPGCGKTALCCELVWPTSKVAKHRFLSKRLLAYHFCQAHDSATLSISNFLVSLTKQIINWSHDSSLGRKKLFTESLANDLLHNVKSEHDLDVAFSVHFLSALAEVDPPLKNLFILVDSIDESWSQSLNSSPEGATSTTIAELLGKHHHLFPPWLLLICTARKQNKLITHLFTGFKKISLDDLKKAHVVRDVQQYILNRLDQDERLKLQLSGESPETLNQLHIKCNGCFLYLEKVLNCVAEKFFTLKEVRDIPGTLNGLYTWFCQKLFWDCNFAEVRPVLNLLLASHRPLTEHQLQVLLEMDGEGFSRIMFQLSHLLLEGHDNTKIIFHHSFSEWLLDVKHCTNRFLCDSADGHARLAVNMSLNSCNLRASQVRELAVHLVYASESSHFSSFDKHQLSMWLLISGVDIENSLRDGLSDNFLANELLISCGAELPNEFAGRLQEQSRAYKSNACHSDQQKKDGIKWKQSMSQSQSSCKEEEKDDELSLPGKKALSDSHDLRVNKSRQEDAKDLKQSSFRETTLASAVRNGDASAVKSLLQSGVTDVNQIDADGWTLLRSAAWGGHRDVVDMLLRVGVDVDQSDKDGRTALRAAAWGGHEEIVLRLLSHQADVNKADKEGRTPLIAAAYMGHSSIVEYLVEFGADVNHEDIDGRTALSVASLCVPASEGHLKVVNQLLECGADPNHKDREGMTPLLVAAYEGLEGVCELLLENDADIDHTDNSGRSALQAAVSMGHYKTVFLLLFWGAAIDAIDAEGRTVLGLASQQGSVEVVRLLLNRGLDETHRDNSGWTPLHIASFEGHKKVVELLLEAGARLVETDNDGKVAMILAAQEGHADVVGIFLDHGTPTEAHGHDGHTALRCAAIGGHKDVVVLLLARGANINCKDADGRTILHALALEIGNTRKNFSPEKAIKMAGFLLDNQANPEERDLEGRSALHLAALQGNYPMAELFLARSKGSDLVLSDCEGRTPFHLAAWRGFLPLVELFLERGTEINRQCVRGETALWLASKEGHANVAATLLKWGTDAEMADNQGRTPYRIASKHGHQNVLKVLREFGCSSKIALGVGSKKLGSSPSTVTSGLGSSLERKNLEGFVNGHGGKQGDSTRSYLLHSKNGRSPVTCRSFSTNQSSSSSGCESGLGRQQQASQLQRKQDYMRQSKSIDYSTQPIPPSSSSSLINSLLSPVQEPSMQKNRSSASSPPFSCSFLASPAISCQFMASPLSEVHSFKASPLGADENFVGNSVGPFRPDEMVIEPIWQRHQDGHGSKAGRNVGLIASGISSPETRKKRNGIVTNPCFSSASSSVTLDSAAHSPSASASRGAVLRPKGLVLKRETPL